MDDDLQLGFDFGAPAEDGYAAWQWERKAYGQKIAKAKGLPIGKKVSLKLYGIDYEFTGVLEVARLPVVWDASLDVELRLAKKTFLNTDIERCVVID